MRDGGSPVAMRGAEVKGREIDPIRLLCAIALALGLAACAGVELQTEIYNSMADARAAGAPARGSVPEAVPPASTELRIGRLSDGRLWGRFAFPAAAAPALAGAMGDEITGTSAGSNPPGRVEWWPPLLRVSADPAQIKATGFRLYRGRSDGLTYAINWGQGLGYYWRQ